jgi:hypothetical protein
LNGERRAIQIFCGVCLYLDELPRMLHLPWQGNLFVRALDPRVCDRLRGQYFQSSERRDSADFKPRKIDFNSGTPRCKTTILKGSLISGLVQLKDCGATHLRRAPRQVRTLSEDARIFGPRHGKRGLVRIRPICTSEVSGRFYFLGV